MRKGTAKLCHNAAAVCGRHTAPKPHSRDAGDTMSITTQEDVLLAPEVQYVFVLKYTCVPHLIPMLSEILIGPAPPGLVV